MIPGSKSLPRRIIKGVILPPTNQNKSMDIDNQYTNSRHHYARNLHNPKTIEIEYFQPLIIIVNFGVFTV